MKLAAPLMVVPEDERPIIHGERRRVADPYLAPAFTPNGGHGCRPGLARFTSLKHLSRFS